MVGRHPRMFDHVIPVVLSISFLILEDPFRNMIHIRILNNCIGNDSVDSLAGPENGFRP